MTFYTSLKKLFYTLIISGVFIACEPQIEAPQGAVLVDIEVNAGSHFEHREGQEVMTFLPYLTNEGSGLVEGRLSDMAVIGKHIKRGQKVYAMPVAKMKYYYGVDEKELIIAIPVEEKHRSVEISSYDDLITEFYSTKQLIEFWYANRYGLGSVSDIRWNSI